MWTRRSIMFGEMIAAACAREWFAHTAAFEGVSARSAVSGSTFVGVINSPF